jgi:hypothetical protein
LPPAQGAPPYWPFDHPKALGNALAANGGVLADRIIAAIHAPADDPQRMPKAPRLPLTAAEQEAFTDFVKSLRADASPGGH